MKPKFGALIGIVIGIMAAVGVLGSLDNQIEDKEGIVFHETLADPQKYENGENRK